jgi:hypothetical protein
MVAIQFGGLITTEAAAVTIRYAAASVLERAYFGVALYSETSSGNKAL